MMQMHQHAFGDRASKKL